MLRGLYSAANAMRYREHEIDVVANNLANVSTDGYKQDRVALRAFGDLLTSRMNDYEEQPKSIPQGITPVGVMNLGGPITESEFIDFSPGTPVVTGNTLDLFLDGPGFFAIETQYGTRYTRNGSFSLSDTGEIVNQNGDRLLGTNTQPLRIVSPAPIEINENGEISQSGVPSGQINIVEFPDLSVIEKEGYNYFTTSDPDELPPLSARNTAVEQGTLETSNVNAIESLVHLIVAQRAYEAAARAVDMFNESLSRVSGEIGRIPV